MHTLSTLKERFAKPGLTVETGLGGLLKVRVHSSVVDGEIYLHGAHVTHFQPSGEQPVLWMSKQSNFEAGKPIRGGVPICFPWFGPHPIKTDAPAHGLARTALWELLATDAHDDGSFVVELGQDIDGYHCKYVARFGKQLELTLNIRLDEEAADEAAYQVALHSYFAVEDVAMINISGLESASYIDKLDGARLKPPTGLAIRFEAECDRVYLDTEATCVLHDPLMGRRIVVGKQHSPETVVWNPWIAKAARMPDFGDDEWPHMVCIEAACARSFRKIQPGEHQLITTRIAVEN